MRVNNSINITNYQSTSKNDRKYQGTPLRPLHTDTISFGNSMQDKIIKKLFKGMMPNNDNPKPYNFINDEIMTPLAKLAKGEIEEEFTIAKQTEFLINEEKMKMKMAFISFLQNLKNENFEMSPTSKRILQEAKLVKEGKIDPIIREHLSKDFLKAEENGSTLILVNPLKGKDGIKTSDIIPEIRFDIKKENENEFNHGFIHVAGSKDEVETLLKLGFDMGQKNIAGYTAIFYPQTLEHINFLRENLGLYVNYMADGGTTAVCNAKLGAKADKELLEFVSGKIPEFEKNLKEANTELEKIVPEIMMEEAVKLKAYLGRSIKEDKERIEILKAVGGLSKPELYARGVEYHCK